MILSSKYVPIVLIVYKRPDTTRRVLEKINLFQPKKLYVISDGPKNSSDFNLVSNTRQLIEKNINDDCDLIKIYSDSNLGCAKRIQTGLDEVFKHEECAIILEDDTLPDLSFFSFCVEMLDFYKNDHRVFHISGCNEHPNVFNTKESYCFSAIINIWGWATWRRAWKCFDLNIPSWEYEDKNNFLKEWCISKRESTGKKKMFDLHCNNPDPWTWDYQWVYSCWKNKGLAITPRVNLVSNIGIGPNATNTTNNDVIPIYPKKLQSICFPLIHTKIKRNIVFEKAYVQASELSIFRKLKNKLRSMFFSKRFIINLFKCFIPIKVRDQFRWAKQPCYSFLRLCIIIRSKKRIISGPFKNLHFGLSNFNTAMILGTWEKELHPFLSNFKFDGPLICIGAAEGYYAVGLAKIYKHSCIYAYETQKTYQSLIRRNAHINGIERINIKGTCEINSLNEVLYKTFETPFIMCDIEGGELELLNLDKIPHLTYAYILVEVHEMYVKNCEKILLSRFASTHDAVVIKGKKRTIDDLPDTLNFLKYFVPENRIISLMSEGRPYPMNWIWFNPLHKK